jgi:hypothetical protein
MRAVGATIKIASRLDAVAGDFAAAMLAFGRQRVNGALKTIEVARDAVNDDFHRLIVFVATDFTSHKILPCSLRFFFAPEAFARGAGHLVVFGIFDSLLDQFFGEGLLIERGNFRRFFANRFKHRFPATVFSQFFLILWLGWEILLARQFAFRLLEV